MTDTVRTATQLLVEARRSRRPIPRLPEDCRPNDADTALAIQTRVGELLGESIAGWKCSAPQPGKVLAAPIWKSNLHRGPRCPVWSPGDTASIEPEIAFVLAKDLPARDTPYGEAEIREAIGEAHLVLELLGSRYIQTAELSFFEKLADSLSNQALIVGPVIPGGVTPGMASFQVEIEGCFSGQGRHPDGHPLVPMHWLPNFLAPRGIGLTAGQVATTGSYAGAIEVPIGRRLHVRFGDIGSMEIELEREQSAVAQ